jgi:UDP-glucose 6-dehydrogenase
MKSKYYLEQNIYQDAVIIGSNIERVQELLEDFFSEENENDTVNIVITFMEKLEACKKYHDSLKKVQIYWENFFSKDKRNELNQ